MLDLTPRQSLQLSPQMCQYLSLLQMTNQQLLAYLRAAFEENPVLELDDAVPPTEYETTDTSRTPADADDRISQLQAESTETLSSYLRFQITQLQVDPQLRAILYFLAADTDERGYLSADIESTVQKIFRVSSTVFTEALIRFQSLDPSGVGARSLEECLILQLRRLHGVNNFSCLLVQNHLEDLAHARYHKIARITGHSQAEIRDALEQIRKLNAKPGAAFAQNKADYIYPDLIVQQTGNDFTVRLNWAGMPVLTISPQYRKLLESPPDEEVRRYLSDKLTHANCLLHNVEQRRQTLVACAEQILRRQQRFFTGDDTLIPFSQAELAKLLDLNPSTISRALNGKYLQCGRGLFPLHFFFPSAVRSEDDNASTDSVKAAILHLIQQENSENPLSDSKLEVLLKEQGLMVSRRMVANYRESLGIPSSIARKRR